MESAATVGLRLRTMGAHMKLDIWKALDGWRWKVIAANGKLVAESGEAYTRKWNAWRAARGVRRHWK